MASLLRIFGAAACLGACALAATPTAAQTLTKRDVSLEQAIAIVNGALEACKVSDPHISIAVLDRAGQVRLMVRTDGASPHNFDLARRKAYTARTFRRPSAEWAKRSAPGQELEAQRQLKDVIALGGGVPIQIGNDTIGAVGVSGNSQTGDEVCARAGVAEIADQLQ